MSRFHTTVTERGSFRSCRRQWYLENVERLQHKDRIPWALIFGNAIHDALAAYYTDNKRNLMDARDAFKAAWEVERDILTQKYGGLYEAGVGDEWLTMQDKGDTMLVYYDEYDRDNPFWDDVVEVNIEERSFVPIPNSEDYTEVHKDGWPLLSGKLDLVVHKKGSGIWVVDHKTAANAYDARALDVDDQLTGYAYIWWRISGDVPRGALYNALIKEPPKPPKVLKNGSLSKDKSQRTVFALYEQAMNELHLGGEEYDEILDYLKVKGWSQFFLRDGLEKNLDEILSFEERLLYEYYDMENALREEGFRYPNPSQRTCPGCGMIALCQAMEERGDIEYIREHMFEQVEPRTVIPEGV